ncbi:MAG: hypothetical protein ACE15E_10120 [Acidobacteriota bacterium]
MINRLILFILVSSDVGQPENPLHFDGLRMLFAGLRKADFAGADIERMSRLNPAVLLGLSGPPLHEQ